MQRYYFHVRDADGLSEDTEGTMLASDERAYIEAAQAASEMLAEKSSRMKSWMVQSLRLSEATACWSQKSP